MRPVERAAGRGVARAVVLQHRAVAVLDLDRGMVAAAAFSIQPSSAMSAEGKAASCARRAPPAGAARSPRAAPRPRPRARRSRARRRRASARSGRGSSSSRLRERSERSSADDAAGMLGVDRQHQPVEKAPPLGGRPDEQPIHRRREPDDAQMIGKGGRRATGSRSMRHWRLRAVSSPAGGSMPVPSVARPSAPSTSAATAQEPSPSLKRRPPRASRAAGRARARGTRSPRSDWSCRRRSARPARPVAARLEARGVVAAEIA